MKKVISKFGGTSMADLQCMSQSAEIVINHNTLVAVVSATSGTTNKLIELSMVAKKEKNWTEVQKIIDQIRFRHQEMIDQKNFVSIQTDFDTLIEEMTSISKGIFFLNDCSIKALDILMSFGERISSLLFSELLKFKLMEKKSDKKVILLDVRNYLVTDHFFGQAQPDISATAEKMGSLNCNSNQVVYVTQGFIGQTSDFQTTTLGRGGSDYSGALIAEALKADELEIWTDVAGIATTDPRLCVLAKPINEISFQEASEMATFGAKVLHPATLAPAIRNNIPVFVGSTFDPKASGTWIRKTVDNGPVFRAVALRNKQVLMTLTTPQMLHAHGFLYKIFKVFNDHKISIDAITTSEISVSLTLDNSARTTEVLSQKIIEELSVFSEVKIEQGYSLVSIIGNKINHTAGIAKRIFQHIENINVRMICLGASRHNFCFLVDEANGPEVVRKLHQGLGFEG
jgi:aspartate kinase